MTHWKEAKTIVTAQDVLQPCTSGDVRSGFNRRVYGESLTEITRDRFSNGDVFQGARFADKLINDGVIYCVHPFRCSREEKCPVRFKYGGYWACNTCNTHINTPDWWIVKTLKDGNAFCIVGQNFENLQESSNYAFGDTIETALENYRNMFLP